MKPYAVIALSGGLLCGSPVSRAQDVAAPGMSNVDMETPEGRQLEAQRKAIIKFLILSVLDELLNINKTKRAMSAKEIVQRKVACMPMKFLKACPKDFRTVIQEWIDAAQGKDEIGRESYVLLNRRLEAVVEKYGIREALVKSRSWVLTDASQPTRSMKLEDMEEHFKRLKDGLEAGTIELPSQEAELE